MVYIHINNQNQNQNQIKNILLNKLHTYLSKQSEFIRLTTDAKEEYKISQKNIYYKEKHVTKNQKYMKYNHPKMKNIFDLTIDWDDEILVPIFSQLPVNYVSTHVTQLQYKLSKKSPISFIIEGTYNTSTIQTMDKPKTFIPLNIYFQCSKNDLHLDNPFFQEELNVFLSLLN